MRKRNKRMVVRTVMTRIYERDAVLKDILLRISDFKCQKCQKDLKVKYEAKEGVIAEGHHILWLSKNGLDVPENVVILCPCCHAEVHTFGIDCYYEAMLKIAKENANLIQKLMNLQKGLG